MRFCAILLHAIAKLYCIRNTKYHFKKFIPIISPVLIYLNVNFSGKPKAQNAAKTRQISTKPERVLDAPDLRDDFYLHLLDWSKNNHMAVALHDTLFIWNAADGSIEELYCKQSEEDYISCVSWVTEGNYLAVGDSCASIDLWDVQSRKLMRTMRGHSDRISSLKWNNHVLASGSRTGSLFLHDVRIAEHHIATLEGHTQVFFVFDCELCSKVLKEALLLFLFFGLAGNHEQKMIQIKQNLCKGTKFVQGNKKCS